MAKVVFYPKGQKPPTKLSVFKRMRTTQYILAIHSIILLYLLYRGIF